MTKFAFTINRGVVSDGIAVEPDGFVYVGEKGRGRTLVRVPVPAGTVENGKVMSIDTSAEGDAVLLVKDHSGFRGGWYAVAAIDWAQRAKDKAACAAANKAHEARRPGLVAAHNDAIKAAGLTADAGWMDVSGATKAAHNNFDAEQCSCTFSPVHRPGDCDVPGCPGARLKKGTPAWRVIAEGWRAQGDAGRMGGGPEFLVAMKKGQAVDLFRDGRLYGAPDILRVECGEDGLIRSWDPIAVAKSESVAGW